MHRFRAVGSLFASGRIVDGILVLMALESLALLLMRRKAAAHFRPVELLVNLGAGGALLLALRAALLRSAWQEIAVCLLAALAFHLFEVKLRWTADRT